MDRTLTIKHAIGIGLVVVLLSAGGAALAGSQTFTDVPPSNQFYDEIERIAAAGITTGFIDGSYRPSQTVSRGAMAAFMSRGFSSVGFDVEPITAGVTTTSASGGPSTPATVASVTVDAGAAQSGQGYVLVTGQATAYSFDAATDCPCEIVGGVQRDSDDAIGPVSGAQIGTQETVNGYAEANISVSWAVPIPASSSETYHLNIAIFEAAGGIDVVAFGTLSALYVPFTASSGSAPPAPVAAEGGLTSGAVRPAP